MTRPTVYSVFLCLLFLRGAAAGADPDRTVKTLEKVTDALREQLQIPSAIQIRIVDTNKLAVSVEPLAASGSFVLSLDASFLAGLNDDELAAAIAHELGHVWIYTHHPFLHTEALANRIAMKAVSRDVLKRLYSKVWAFEGKTGKTGDVDDLLGPGPAPQLVGSPALRP